MTNKTFEPRYQDNFSRYFQDELRYLKDLGGEFARQDPDRAHFEFEQIADPDVLCLLEGFSFLTARVRQKLDDELPELTHSLLGLLYPHYLRPIPATTVVQFTAQSGAVQGKLPITRGTSLQAKEKEGTVCRFQTTANVDLWPVRLVTARLERRGAHDGVLQLRFERIGNVDLGTVGLDNVRLYLAGEEEDARTMLWLLQNRAERIELRPSTEGILVEEDVTCLPPTQHVGFEVEGNEVEEPSTSLLPYPARSFAGYRLLQEYFTQPAKFHFVDLSLKDPGGRPVLSGTKAVDGFEVRFMLRDMPEKMHNVHEEQFQLFCTPVVNLFQHDAIPIVVDHKRSEYVVRPQGELEHHEIFSVDTVSMFEPERRDLPHFFSFRSSAAMPDGASTFYETRVRPSQLDGFSTETYLRFVTQEAVPVCANEAVRIAELDLPQDDKLSVEITCTNRHLPAALTPAEICEPTEDVPSSVTFRGIEPITSAVSPPLGGGLHWRLVSHLSLNYLSLASAETLQGVLEVYDFQALQDEQTRRRSRKRLAAIKDVQSRLSDEFHEGRPVRAVHTTVVLDEKGFSGNGDMYLFGCVLERFLALYVAANCFSRVTIEGMRTGLRIRFPARGGMEILL